MSTVRDFIRHHFRHFNAAALRDAAEGYARHVEQGGKMLVTLAGAMSTAELGLSLAPMIRAGRVHAISCTGANLEEDLFNLVAHDCYVRVPHYRELSTKDEESLLARHLNRVTDTCIPEEQAIRRIEAEVLREKVDAAVEELATRFDQFAFSVGLEAWMGAVFACNAYVDAAAPWALRKTDPERMADVLGTLVAAIRKLAAAVVPVIPASAEKLLAVIDSGLQGALDQPSPIFPRLELDEAAE